MSVDDETATRPGAASAAPAGRIWLGLIFALVAAFMQLLDVTVVTVASAEIQRDLSASNAQVQWTLAAYQLAFAAGLVTGGRLGDIYGCRRILLIGLAGFTMASLLCGLADDPGMLVGFRALQGLTAALMFPQVQSIIQAYVTGPARAKAFGALGAVTGLAGVAGPLLGGVLIEADLAGWGWRAIFLINVPVGLIALVGGYFYVKEWRSPEALRLDLVGAALAALGVVLLVYPLIQGNEAHWAWWIWAVLAASVPVFGLFVMHQRAMSRRGATPLVDARVFRGGSFGVGLIVLFTCFAGVSALFLVIAVGLQAGQGFSPLTTGLAFLPIALAMGVGSGVSVPLSKRLGKTAVQVGCVVMMIGTGGLIYTLHAAADGLTIWQLVPAEVVVGIGLGIVVATVNDVVLAEARGPSVGSASGVKSMVGQVGNAVGVAVLGTVFFGLATRYTAEGDRQGFTNALADSLYYEIGVFLIAFLVLFFLPRRTVPAAA